MMMTTTRPSFPAGTARSFIVSEHAAVGTYIGTVRGSDDDSNDILSHELAPGDDTDSPDNSNRNAGKFAVDMATGRITVASKLDFETAPDGRRRPRHQARTTRSWSTVYDPSGAHTDGDGDDIGRTVNIQVTDQNDKPMTPDCGVGDAAQNARLDDR